MNWSEKHAELLEYCGEGKIQSGTGGQGPLVILLTKHTHEGGGNIIKQFAEMNKAQNPAWLFLMTEGRGTP